MTRPNRKPCTVVCLAALLAFALLCPSPGVSAPVPVDDSTGATKAEADTSAAPDGTSGRDTFVAYYFHGTQRCVTCRKLEAYSEEALTSGFTQEITDSVLHWRPVNFDEKPNEHFIKDYKLFTKSVILSRIRTGEEIEWKNLDKIWKLVGNKEEFISYIQAETRAFLRGDDTNE